MIHLAASAFFVLAFLAAAVIIHLTVRAYWAEIILALRGELGLKQPVRQAPARAMRPRHAAF